MIRWQHWDPSDPVSKSWKDLDRYWWKYLVIVDHLVTTVQASALHRDQLREVLGSLDKDSDQVVPPIALAQTFSSTKMTHKKLVQLISNKNVKRKKQNLTGQFDSLYSCMYELHSILQGGWQAGRKKEKRVQGMWVIFHGWARYTIRQKSGRPIHSDCQNPLW